MSGDEFNFRKLERREPRRFEPPPWELEESQPEAQLEEPQSEASAAGKTQEPTKEPPAKQDVAEHEPDSAAREEPAEGANVEAMLSELKTEEETDRQGLYRLTTVMAVIVTGIGVVTAIGGLVCTFRMGGSATGFVLALVLLATGVGFSAIGMWLLYKTSRQRGAL